MVSPEIRRLDLEKQMTFTSFDEHCMQLALEEARKAGDAGDVPVGAVLVDHRTATILAKGRNTREVAQTALGHAEINAISEGCHKHSAKLCGGMFVAIPTAIPSEPLTKMLGILDGRTTGCISVSSKLG